METDMQIHTLKTPTHARAKKTHTHTKHTHTHKAWLSDKPTSFSRKFLNLSPLCLNAFLGCF